MGNERDARASGVNKPMPINSKINLKTLRK